MRLLILLLLSISASAQPTIPISVTRPVTNGTVMLAWRLGIPSRNTVSNLTTGTAIASGPFNFYMASGLMIGSTNVFVVANVAGSSNTATGVAEPYIPKAEMRVYSYLVTVPAKTNGQTTILTSTNLSVWTRVAVVTNGPTYSFVWTNEGAGSRFFRSVSP